MKTSQGARTGKMVRLAILTAIIILMAFTPLGYLKTGVVVVSFLTIPVVIGAMIMGPAAGAFLGGVFGLTSFFQCFGLDAFGVALMGINPFLTFVVCVVPRVLVGLIPGLLFKPLRKADKSGVWSYAVTSLSGAVVNTVFFVGLLLLFFGNTDYLRQFGDSVFAIAGVLVTFNAAIEAVVCLVVGGAIAKALNHLIPVAGRSEKKAKATA